MEVCKLTTTSLNSPKDYAYYYRDKLEFSVFPLKNPEHRTDGRLELENTEGVKERKEPAVPIGHPWFDMKPTNEQIELWFKNNPNYNLAIPMGPVSQAIAFDVDGVTAVARVESKIPEMSSSLREAFANTMKNRTGGGGEHIVFKIEGQIDDVGRRQLWKDGKKHSQILLIARRSYIVAAPSRHPNGKIYEWNGKEPQTITRQELEEFIRLINPSSSTSKQQQQQSRPQEERTLNPEQMNELLSWIQPYYAPGDRDHFIFYLSGMMHKAGFTQEIARRFVELLVNSSEYPDEDLDKSLTVVDNTYRKTIDEINGKTGLHDLFVASYESDDNYYNKEEYLQRCEAFSKICQIINGEPESPPPDDEDDDDDKKRTAKAKQALELAVTHSQELFVNEFGRPFAAMKMSDGHVEVHPMDEGRFKNWISGIFYNTHDELLNDDDLKKIVRILTARAEFDGNIPRRSLDIRVRGYNEAEYNSNNNDENGVSDVGSVGSFGELVEDFDAIYYDLTNKKWEAIKITSEGWEIDNHPPFLFRRFGGEAPQGYPDRNYEPDVLDRFADLLNLKPEYAETQKLVLKVKIVTDFWPNTTPKPILILQSSHGSGKTTGFELIRDLVDPNSALTMSIPRDEAQLKQALAHNYMAFFDNLSDITDGQSDILCRGVTGSGDVKCKLYENDEDIIYSYRRIEGVNGITNVVTRSDLADRGFAVDFAEIPKDKRELLRIIRRNHLQLKPKVLAFCLDVISEVMAERKKWKGIDDYYFGVKDVIAANGGLPRMADWAILGEQVAAVIARKEGVEYEPGTFLRAFDKNLDILNTEALKSSLVAEALIAFVTNREIMEHKTEWEGSATMLLADLNTFIVKNVESVKINTRAKAWPQDPSVLGKELAKIAPNLGALGIQIHPRRTKHNIHYFIEKMPTLPTLPTPSVSNYNIQAQNTPENHEENGETIQKGVCGVGGVGNNPNEGSTISDTTIQELLNKAVRNKDYFTEDDWVFACLLWPNLKMTVKETEQTLQQLLQEGEVRELEPGKHQPTDNPKQDTEK